MLQKAKEDDPVVNPSPPRPVEDRGFDPYLVRAEDDPVVYPSPPRAAEGKGFDHLLQRVKEDNPLVDPSPPKLRRSSVDKLRCVP